MIYDGCILDPTIFDAAPCVSGGMPVGGGMFVWGNDAPVRARRDDIGQARARLAALSEEDTLAFLEII